MQNTAYIDRTRVCCLNTMVTFMTILRRLGIKQKHDPNACDGWRNTIIEPALLSPQMH